MRALRPVVTLAAVASCGVLAPPAAARGGGETSGIKITVTPTVVTDTSAIKVSFRAPYRLKKGHNWAVWLDASTGASDHPELAKGGWLFRRAVAPGKKITVTFTPESPGTLSMIGSKRRTGQKWCSGWASIKVLDHRRREARSVGEKRFRIHKTT